MNDTQILTNQQRSLTKENVDLLALEAALCLLGWKYIGQFQTTDCTIQLSVVWLEMSAEKLINTGFTK